MRSRSAPSARRRRARAEDPRAVQAEMDVQPAVGAASLGRRETEEEVLAVRLRERSTVPSRRRGAGGEAALRARHVERARRRTSAGGGGPGGGGCVLRAPGQPAVRGRRARRTCSAASAAAAAGRRCPRRRPAGDAALVPRVARERLREERLDERDRLLRRVHPGADRHDVGVVVLPAELAPSPGSRPAPPGRRGPCSPRSARRCRAADDDAEAARLADRGGGGPQAVRRVVVLRLVAARAVVDDLVARRRAAAQRAAA